MIGSENNKKQQKNRGEKASSLKQTCWKTKTRVGSGVVIDVYVAYVAWALPETSSSRNELFFCRALEQIET